VSTCYAVWVAVACAALNQTQLTRVQLHLCFQEFQDTAMKVQDYPLLTKRSQQYFRVPGSRAVVAAAYFETLR
jgi:hypothetical protein